MLQKRKQHFVPDRDKIRIGFKYRKLQVFRGAAIKQEVGIGIGATVGQQWGKGLGLELELELELELGPRAGLGARG